MLIKDSDFTARVVPGYVPDKGMQGGYIQRKILGIPMKWFSLFNSTNRNATKVIKCWQALIKSAEALEASKEEHKAFLEMVKKYPDDSQTRSQWFSMSGRLFPFPSHRDVPSPDMKKVDEIVKIVNQAIPKSSLEKKLDIVKEFHAKKDKQPNKVAAGSIRGASEEVLAEAGAAEIVTSDQYQGAYHTRSNNGNQNSNKQKGQQQQNNQRNRDSWPGCEK